MLHVVEIRFTGETFRHAISRVRRWLDDQGVQPTTFRYWLYEPDSVLRINFELEEHAQAFALAFGGIVLLSCGTTEHGSPIGQEKAAPATS